MKKFNHQKGFTLVELAIVLTIIGLLIGGILKGQQLMTNARISATASQIQAIDAAVTTFRDTYNAIPGDMLTPNTRMRGVTVTGATVTTGTVGDGIVGDNNWTLQAAKPYTAASLTPREETLFWAELSAANLLSGIAYSAGAASPPAATAAIWGQTNPAARIGGGFIAGYANGVAIPTGNPGTSLLSGLVIALTTTPTAALGAATTGAWGLLSPMAAQQLDAKSDDGSPTTGSIQYYGSAPGAAGATQVCATTAVPSAYNITLGNAKACGLFWQLQG